MASPEELRKRRAEQARRRRIGRRRLLALAGVAALAGCTGVGFAIHGGSSEDESETSSAPRPDASDLPTNQLVGQRLIAGFEGTKVPKGLERMINRGRIAGVILFAENVSGRKSTARLIASLQRIDRPEGLTAPLAVMADQEGGLVKRIPGPPGASASEMGERSEAYALRQGAATGRNLLRYGVNIDLAPVLDVARSGSAIAAEGRTFGRSPAKVTEVGVEGFARGLLDAGVVSTAKHFPGLGGAKINTDDAAQQIDLSRARLRALDEVPFESYISNGGRMVMLGLATYRAFGDAPAALNRRIATSELRGELGFDGVTITDSLDAAAATSFASRDRVAVTAAGAGSDLLLYGDWRTARSVSKPLRKKLASGKLDRDEFEASVGRVLALRQILKG